MNRLVRCSVAAALLLAACREDAPPPLYEAVAVVRRDIVVSAEAAGTIEPILVIDVKSKASGEIMALNAETGDIVAQGDLLVAVDPREPRNLVAQAEADLEVARSQLATAEANKRRTDQMFASQLVSEQEHEQAVLQHANARAQLVRAERALQTATDQLDDTNVRAPISGTIIQKNVERGTVISSATREVSGGTVLLRMADLNEVQVRTLVDETDIGKIQSGMRATITVDAYPNRPFEGTVLKIEPQSTTNQNVTMFPVLIRIGNQDGLLRPGMNAEVEIHVAQRSGVLAIPNAALRTQRDVASAATVLGLDPAQVDQTLARDDSAQAAQMAANPAARTSQTSQGGRTEPRQEPSRQQPAPAPATQAAAPAAPPAPAPQPGGPQGAFQMPLPAGVTPEMAAEIRRKRQAGEALTPAESTASARIREHVQRLRDSGQMPSFGQGGGTAQQGGAPAAPATPAAPAAATQAPGGPRLPAGVTQEQVRAIMQKRMSGQPLTAQEQAISRMLMASVGSSSSSQRRRFGAGNNFQFGGSYIVFVLREGRPTPVRIRTGVTDLDYSEVSSGLTEQDTVLLLPSASLLNNQAEFRERMQRMTGGGAVPGMQQRPTGR